MAGTTHLYSPYGLPNATITPNWLANTIVAAVFPTLGTVVLILRLITTLLFRRRAHGADDWAIYAAYVASVGYTIASIIALRYGVGLRQEEVGPRWNVQALKATYAVEIFYYASVFLVKVSILCMYLRLWRRTGGRDPAYRATLWTMGVLVAHFASTMAVAAVQCVPMTRFWDPAAAGARGRCINITAFFYSTNAFTILADLVVLALPLRTLLGMNMPRRKKLGFVGGVAVGGVSTVASCVRLYSVRMFRSTSRGLEDAAPINTWSFVEINTAIFCASVPAIGALFMGRDSRRASVNAPHDEKRLAGRRRRFDSHRLCGTESDLFRDDDDDDDDDEEDLELGEASQSRRPKQRQSHLALQSAVMTTSRGSLKNYRMQPGSARTGTGSGDLAGRAAEGAREGV